MKWLDSAIDRRIKAREAALAAELDESMRKAFANMATFGEQLRALKATAQQTSDRIAESLYAGSPRAGTSPASSAVLTGDAGDTQAPK